MADHNLDEYESLDFYAKNTKPKKFGFSKFQVEDRYYFCRYVDGDIAMISQAYTGKPGRDNGIESVKKNEKIASRYVFAPRGKTKQGFGLKAGNGQEIAISPDYATLGKAQSVASRMSGASFTGAASAKRKTATKSKAATKNPVAKKALAKKAQSRKAASFTSKDSRIENYKPLSFYEQNGSLKKGFNSFEKDGAYYFHYVENGKVVLISESYTSKRGRDNGIVSVTKNMGLKSAYEYHQHKNGKHYFDLNAANGQEIATSRWYTTKINARNGAAYLNGEKKRPAKSSQAKAAQAKTKTVRSASEEDNYPPLAFYRRQTKGKAKGFEKFRGDDGEYYFTYFENSKLALISEGYPTAAIRDKGVASVQKNMKIEKRYVQGTGADGKTGFILRAGNHKEIARSVGYGSAAAAVAGAAYLMGTRRRPAATPKVAKPKVAKVKKPAPVKKAPVKKTVVKKAAVKPKPKVKPLAAGTVAVAGLAATAAAAKPNDVKKSAIPVKAAPIKAPPTPTPPVAAPIKAPPVSAPPVAAAIKAAPIAAAAVGMAAVGAAALSGSTPKAEPVAVAKAAPIAAAAPVAAATVEGAGIWGWLRWLLLALLALFAMFFLFKSCVGGEKAATVPPITTSSAAPAAMITCWNGSKAKDDDACPTKVTCWDESFATSLSSCPARPVERNFNCWDGSKAVDLAGCPIKPAPKVEAAPVKPKAKPSSPSVTARFCAPSTNPLFNVSGVTPKSVTRLGTNTQFGNSTSLSPSAFYGRLQNRYQTSANDKAFLDHLAKSLGYGSFQNMDASMFTNDTLAQGSTGLLGFGQNHAVQFSTLNVIDPADLDAFKVRSANGTDVHFMKRCGNFMYVCQP